MSFSWNCRSSSIFSAPKREHSLRLERDLRSAAGVLPRGGGLEALRWVEIQPCYVYHVANAFETADGTIALDVARYEFAWRADGKRTGARLRRWRIPPGASKAEEAQLDDQKIEFPRIDDRNTGRPHTVVYALANNRDLESGSFGGLLRMTSRAARPHTTISERAGRPASLRLRLLRGLKAKMKAGSSASFTTGRATPAISSFSTRSASVSRWRGSSFPNACRRAFMAPGSPMTPSRAQAKAKGFLQSLSPAVRRAERPAIPPPASK